MNIKYASSLIALTLLAGCAAKVTPFNPQQDDLRSYAKRLIEDNRYHINQKVVFFEGEYPDGMKVLSVHTTSHMGGNPFYLAMIDACRVGGGLAEEVTKDRFNTHSDEATGYGNWAFICRHRGTSRGSTLVKVSNIAPYQLGRQYFVNVFESRESNHEFSSELYMR